MTDKQALEAALLLKEYCNSITGTFEDECWGCVFNTESGCKLSVPDFVPEEWELDTKNNKKSGEPTEKPSEKQIDFATAIAETLGIDLPEEFSRDEYHMFISDNVDEFYEVRDEVRYGSGDTFTLGHSYVLNDGFNGNKKLRINPKTR